ncbi:hypothetical protein [Bdellovibrio reynosensis]|uniref:Polymer-forming cytoskeletal protein n=1 Tax=Bdellovibrio reynosensis TaxID=2835041 RepID=A0ABY4C684_9BACT|nr:hypothetical protein [Bdellovibrio reynosensis]UOE99998.1 hypothetical protein MNR06_09830 [Bdellovibrio reynosensis]
MKPVIASTLLSLLVGVSTACAGTSGKLAKDVTNLNDLNHNGVAEIQNGSVKGSAKIRGRLIAKDVQFAKSLDVNGRVELDKSQVAESLNVDGRATLKDSSVRGESYFRGVAILEQSHLQGAVTIRGDQGSSLRNVTLDSSLNFLGNELEITGKSSVKKIAVDPSPEHPLGPIIRLGADVTVDGDIEFRSAPGRVYVSPTTVIRGKVIKGEVLR